MLGPIELFERAAEHAVSLAEQVAPEERDAPTPCVDWNVEALLTHMIGGTEYLLTALGRDVASDTADVNAYRSEVARCAEALHQPRALEGRCMSPAGFEWSIADAAAGTAMDQLVHTWDLAVAIGADRRLDSDAVQTCLAMFVPQMPEIGRTAGFVGPEVVVPANASAQDRLLGAMGRQP